MDIVVLVLALVIGFFVLRLTWAFGAIVVVWAVALVMVGWGPAHGSGVHTGSAGFWVPWLVVLLISFALAYGARLLRLRRARGTRAS